MQTQIKGAVFDVWSLLFEVVLLSAVRLLPPAFCLPPSASCFLLSQDRWYKATQMRKLILVPALVLFTTPALAQTANNESVGGGKTSTTKPAVPATKVAPKKTTPKRTATVDKPLSSPCGVYYKDRADMIAESNLPNQWSSLGQSANNHFWYNPRKTTCDAQSGVLKSWIKEEHKNTDGDFALVLYEMK